MTKAKKKDTVELKYEVFFNSFSESFAIFMANPNLPYAQKKKLHFLALEIKKHEQFAIDTNEAFKRKFKIDQLSPKEIEQLQYEGSAQFDKYKAEFKKMSKDTFEVPATKIVVDEKTAKLLTTKILMDLNDFITFK